MKQKLKSLLFLLTFLSIESGYSYSLIWDEPFVVNKGNPTFSTMIANLEVQTSGQYTCKVTFTGVIQVTQIKIAFNGDIVTRVSYPNGAFGPSDGSSVEVVFGIYNKSQNNFEISMRSHSWDWCDQGTVNFEFALGNQVVYTTSATVKIKPELNDDDELNINGNNYGNATVFEGCTDMLFLQMAAFRCPGTGTYRLFISELDRNNNFSVITSTSVDRFLTTTEITSLQTGGLNLRSFTGTGGTIDLVSDKYFLINLVEVTNGKWWPFYRRVHVKSGTWDIYMEDGPKIFSTFDITNKNYYAYEPFDIYDDDIFRSPSLWNKLSTTLDQNSINNEYPDYVTVSGNTNKLFFKTMTLGCDFLTTPNVNNSVRLFWTIARTDETWDKDWKYDMVNNTFLSTATNDPVAAGSEITISGATQLIPYKTSNTSNTNPVIIPSGQSTYQLPWTLGVDWYPPNRADFAIDPTSRVVICLLARINEPTSSFDPIVNEPTDTKITPYVKNYNNVVTRNTILYNDKNFLVDNGDGDWDYGFTTVMVNNSESNPRVVSLCVDILPEGGSPGTFDDYGTIQIRVTEGLYTLWTLGGNQTANLNVVSPTLFEMTSGTHACLNNITLPANFQEDLMGLRFQYDSLTLPMDTAKNYSYQLSMIDAEGTKGSNTIFEVNVPTETPTELYNTKRDDKNQNDKSHLIIYPNPASDKLILNAYDLNINTSDITIYDNTGRLIKIINCNSITNFFTREIDTKQWGTGIYFIKYKTDNNIITRKINIIH